MHSPGPRAQEAPGSGIFSFSCDGPAGSSSRAGLASLDPVPGLMLGPGPQSRLLGGFRPHGIRLVHGMCILPEQFQDAALFHSANSPLDIGCSCTEDNSSKDACFGKGDTGSKQTTEEAFSPRLVHIRREVKTSEVG